MRLPKPKSGPGIFLWGTTSLALFVVFWLLSQFAQLNVQKWAEDRGYDKLLSKRWDLVVRWLTENQFWLAVSAAFLVGAALALWLNVAITSRSEASNADIPPSPVDDWVTPEVARRDLLRPTYQERIDETHAQMQTAADLAEVARKQWEARQDDEARKDRFQDLGTKASLANHQLDAAHNLATLAMLEELKEGRLIAKGIELINNRAEDEKLIPEEYWRFLHLNIAQESAGGQFRKYVGLRIGKPIRQF